MRGGMPTLVQTSLLPPVFQSRLCCISVPTIKRMVQQQHYTQ
jgi:hypothetical protein